MNIANLIGLLAGALNMLSALPQLKKAFKGDSSQVSFSSWLIVFVAELLWMTYHIMRKNYVPLLFGSFFVTTTLLLLLKLYANKKRSKLSGK